MSGKDCINLTFGQYLRLTRSERGWAQYQLAERLCISEQYLSDIENDKRNAPPDEMLHQIAEALGEYPDIVFYAAGRFAPDLRGYTSGIESSLRILRKMLKPERVPWEVIG